jgi:hypothetical protein
MAIPPRFRARHLLIVLNDSFRRTVAFSRENCPKFLGFVTFAVTKGLEVTDTLIQIDDLYFALQCDCLLPNLGRKGASRPPFLIR